MFGKREYKVSIITFISNDKLWIELSSSYYHGHEPWLLYNFFFDYIHVYLFIFQKIEWVLYQPLGTMWRRPWAGLWYCAYEAHTSSPRELPRSPLGAFHIFLISMGCVVWSLCRCITSLIQERRPGLNMKRLRVKGQRRVQLKTT